VNRGSKQIVAIGAGAAAYALAAFLRASALSYFGVKRLSHWLSPFDASLIYLIGLTAGFLAALIYRQRTLLIGFSAAAIGEIAHGLIKLLVAFYAAGWLMFPPSFIFDILMNGLPAGILGAAGASVAIARHGKRAE
jgi:hypothetical protein